MTISAFCRDQLLTHGPLPLETLAERAAGAGTTTARDPASAVRSAIAHKEVLLADGRWATPLWLLEGRILTACRLPFADTWPESDLGVEDGDAPAYDLYLDDLGPEEVADGSRHDLALLDLALKSSSLPLATGGLLRRAPYRGGWRVPKGWPGRRAGRDQLLGLRVRAGQLHVELVPVTDELHAAGRRLAQELGPISSCGQSWSGEDSLVSQNLAGALWNRMAADAELLTSPVPPFSRCIPSLAQAVRREHDRRVADAFRWRPQLDLPADLQRVAAEQAGRSGQLLDDWLDSCVARTLRSIGQSDVIDAYADVLPLQRRR